MMKQVPAQLIGKQRQGRVLSSAAPYPGPGFDERQILCGRAMIADGNIVGWSVAVPLFGAACASPESPFEEDVRAQTLKRRDGPMAHVESQYK